MFMMRFFIVFFSYPLERKVLYVFLDAFPDSKYFLLLLAVGGCGSETIGTVDAPATRTIANQSFATNSSYANQLQFRKVQILCFKL